MVLEEDNFIYSWFWWIWFDHNHCYFIL